MKLIWKCVSFKKLGSTKFSPGERHSLKGFQVDRVTGLISTLNKLCYFILPSLSFLPFEYFHFQHKETCSYSVSTFCRKFSSSTTLIATQFSARKEGSQTQNFSSLSLYLLFWDGFLKSLMFISTSSCRSCRMSEVCWSLCSYISRSNINIHKRHQDR